MATLNEQILGCIEGTCLTEIINETNPNDSTNNPTIIKQLRLMCQVNSAEGAYNFYKKHIFLEYKNLERKDFHKLI